MRRYIFLGYLPLLLLTENLLAQQSTPKVIEGFESNGKVAWYDADFNMVKEVRESEMAAFFRTLQVDGQERTGILIQEFNADEGMYRVQLEGAPALDGVVDGMVWVEALNFKVWPGREIVCPASVVGKVEELQEDGTVGFGGC